MPPTQSPTRPDYSSTLSFSSLNPENIPWLWTDRLPLGQLSLLASRPGVGKSLLTSCLAAHVSTGSPWPDQSPCPLGSVILIPREDDPAQVIRPRLLAHNANLQKIHLLTPLHNLTKCTSVPEVFFSLQHYGPLEDALEDLPDCKLIVLDPISAFFPNYETRHDSIIRKNLDALLHLAQHFGPAILLVHHLQKRPAQLADQSIFGGGALASISRNVWHLLPDPQNKSRRLFLPGKTNLSRPAPGLAFTIDPTPPNTSPNTSPRIQWDPTPLKMDADDAAEILKPGPQPHSRRAAQIWLTELLTPAPMLVTRIREEAQSAGLSWRTLQRAADEIPIERTRDPNPHSPWTWRLPPIPI